FRPIARAPAGAIRVSMPGFVRYARSRKQRRGRPMAESAASQAEAFRAAEHAGWQSKVAAYDQHWSPLSLEIGERLLDAAGVRRGARVLDVACGPGRLTAAAAARGADVAGVDFSDRMIERARRLFPVLDFRVGDAEALPFPDESADAVVVNFGVLHFARPDYALVEACRVLTAGATLACTLGAGPAEPAGMRVMFDAIEEYGRIDAAIPEGPPQFLFTEPAACATLLTTAGFERTSIAHKLIRATWRLPAPDGLFAAYADGAVRIALLLAAQSPQSLSSIRSAVSAACLCYAAGPDLRVPVAAVVVTARRS